MKSLLAFLLVAAPLLLSAQDYAPASVGGKIATYSAASGSGVMPTSGTSYIVMARSGLFYVSDKDGVVDVADKGTFSYEKTGPNTAVIRNVRAAQQLEILSTLTFTSETGGTYTASVATPGIPGSQSGSFYLAPYASESLLVNLSTKVALAANEPITVGFIVGGTSKRRVLVRAIGPGLTAFGVANAMADPRLTVFSGQTQTAANNDWSSTTANRTAVEQANQATQAFALTPGSRDAAAALTLSPGPYTVEVRGPGAGEVLIEVYIIE